MRVLRLPAARSLKQHLHRIMSTPSPTPHPIELMRPQPKLLGLDLVLDDQHGRLLKPVDDLEYRAKMPRAPRCPKSHMWYADNYYNDLNQHRAYEFERCSRRGLKTRPQPNP